MSISGTAQVGAVLTATLADPDGARCRRRRGSGRAGCGHLYRRHPWRSGPERGRDDRGGGSRRGGDAHRVGVHAQSGPFTAIAGADSATYTPVAADDGKYLITRVAGGSVLDATGASATPTRPDRWDDPSEHAFEDGDPDRPARARALRRPPRRCWPRRRCTRCRRSRRLISRATRRRGRWRRTRRRAMSGRRSPPPTPTSATYTSRRHDLHLTYSVAATTGSDATEHLTAFNEDFGLDAGHFGGQIT